MICIQYECAKFRHNKPLRASSIFRAASPSLKPPLDAQRRVPSPISNLSSCLSQIQGQWCGKWTHASESGHRYLSQTADVELARHSRPGYTILGCQCCGRTYSLRSARDNVKRRSGCSVAVAGGGRGVAPAGQTFDRRSQTGRLPAKRMTRRLLINAC